MVRLFLLLTFYYCSLWTLLAQDTWSLQECVDYAVTNSFDIKLENNNIANAEVNLKQSKDSRLPNLNAGSNATWNFGRSLDPVTNEFITATFFSNGYSLNSQVSLFDGGRINNDIKRSQTLVKVAEASQNTQANLITIDIVRAYFDVLLAKDNLKNTVLQQENTEQQLQQINKLIEAGSRAAFERYDLEAQLASNEQLVTEAQNAIDQAALRLKTLMNFNPSYELDIVEPESDYSLYTPLESLDFEEAFARALSFQPSTALINQRIVAAQHGLEVAKSGYYPSISAGANISTNFSNNPFVETPYLDQINDNFAYGFGFNLSVPIYNRGVVKNEVARSKVQLDNLDIQKQQNEAELRNSLLQLITDTKTAKKSMEAAQKTLEAREIAFTQTTKRYKLGATNSFDYMNSQNQLNQARTSFLLAKYRFLLNAKLLDYFQGYPVSM